MNLDEDDYYINHESFPYIRSYERAWGNWFTELISLVIILAILPFLIWAWKSDPGENPIWIFLIMGALIIYHVICLIRLWPGISQKKKQVWKRHFTKK